MSEDLSSEPTVVKIVHLSEQVDEAYRAIGHYFVAFAHLIALMRQILTEEVIGTREGGPNVPRAALARLALGGLEAMRVADAFFATCRTIGALDDDDRRIEKVLRERHVYKALTRRNEIAHGEWLIYEYSDAPSEDVKHIESMATLVRVQPRDPDEPFKHEDLTAKDIEQEAADVEALERLLCEFGCICTKQGDYAPGRPQAGVRVRDAFELVGKANRKHVELRPRNSPELWPNNIR